ncbi:ATPase, T2SS/T4P/T4SS family [Achromobacter ruhlandii]|uniref:ATPase, T2SS/T4P/T4SS family n=1 Tax=Achromobacter ruhlandii TaxID=72557 RepID=UPI003BA12033
MDTTRTSVAGQPEIWSGASAGVRLRLPPDQVKHFVLLSNHELHYATLPTDITLLSLVEEIRHQLGFDPTLVQSLAQNIARIYDEFGDAATAHTRGGTKMQDSGRQRAMVRYLRNAIDMKATDLDIIIGRKSADLRLQVLGDWLKPTASVSREEGFALVTSLIETMSLSVEGGFVEKRRQDARLRDEYVSELGIYGARIATSPTSEGHVTTIRLLHDSGLADLSFLDLGYNDRQAAILESWTTHTDGGLHLLSGPTAVGKSRSLKTFCERVSANANHLIKLITLEDPVESKIAGAIQIGLDNFDKYDEASIAAEWNRGLRQSLRMTPKWIVPGEIRDGASAVTTINAATTGHAAISTLHVLRWDMCLDRLAALGVPDFLLTDAGLIRGLSNQSLARVLCPHCKESWSDRAPHLFTEDRDLIEAHCDIGNIYFRGEGCPHCKGLGVMARTVVAEVADLDEGLMEVYQAHGALAMRREWAQQRAGITKRQHMIDKINAGMLDPLLSQRDVVSLRADDILGTVRR